MAASLGVDIFFYKNEVHVRERDTFNFGFLGFLDMLKEDFNDPARNVRSMMQTVIRNTK